MYDLGGGTFDVTVLRGNAGEIATLVGAHAEVRGVESITAGLEPAELARAAAQRLGVVASVTGPVDHDTVEQLRAAIGHAGRGGGLELTVDLAAVTHLASTGLQLLHTLNTGDGPAGVHFVAPDDSTAHQALALSGLIR